MSRIVSFMVLALLFLGTFTLAFSVRPVSAQAVAVYINSDGSVSPSGAPISSVDNVTYTFIGDIAYPNYSGIVVERNNIVIDGAGYVLQGTGAPGSLGVDMSAGNVNVTVRNTQIEDFDDGIGMWLCSDVSITGNNITGDYGSGVLALLSLSNSISGNNITDDGYGVNLGSSSSNSVGGNNITDNDYGVCLDGSSHCVVAGNTFTDDGLLLSASFNNVVYSNLVNGRPLVYLEGDLYPSTVSDAGEVVLVGCANMVVDNLNVSNATVSVELWQTNNTEVTNNTVTDNAEYGIYVGSSSNDTVSGNNVADNYYGIYLDSSSGSSIIGNNVTANSNYGVWLDSSSGNSISENNIVSNDYYGMELYSSPSNSITGNNITSNYQVGIYLFSSSNIIFTGNNVTANNGTGMYLYSCSGDSISGNNVTATGWNAIFLLFSSGDSVSGNNITDNMYGVWLESSWSDSISGNNITANTVLGVLIDSSSGNSISRNNVTANKDGGIGLVLSSNNSVTENNIADNHVGMSLSSNNTIYHNNFVGNTIQVLGESSVGNVWDDGYPSGGNYWSDYNGTDLHSGPYQNVDGSDGIGDKPYVIDSNNTDDYPLMGVFSDFSLARGLDVQVVSNFTVSDFQFNGTAILFNVSGTNGTTGFCNVRVPTSLVNGTLTIHVNRTQVQYNMLPGSNSSISYLYFTYGHPTEQVTIMPEYPDSLILAALIIATLLTIANHNKKRSRSYPARSLDYGSTQKE